MAEIDPALPLYGLRTLDAEISELSSDQRFMARVASTLGVVALLLTALGLYALLGYTVVQRRREIGIRSALGALPRTLLAAVVGSGLRLTAAGLALGLGGAAYLGRFLEARLFGIKPFDAGTYAVGAGLLLAIAFTASYVPARRAARIDPVEVLSAD